MFKRHAFAPRAALLVLLVGLLLPFNSALAAAPKPTVAPAPHIVSRQETAKPSASTSPSTAHAGPVAAPMGAKTNQPKQPSTTRPGVTPAFSLSLVSSNEAPQVNQNFTLTVASDQNVGPTPYDLEIYYGTVQEAVCGSGTTCAVTLFGSQAGATYVFQARVAYADGSNVQSYSNTVTVHIYPTWSVSLATSNSMPQVNQNYTLTAYANQDVGPTPYYIQIYFGGLQEATCASGTSCSVTLINAAAGSYIFMARISRPDGSIVEASSNSVTVTSPSSLSVSLSSSNYNPHVNQTYTLTATASQNVGPTAFYIEIYQGSTQKVRCSSGTTCSISLVGHTAGVSKKYKARIAYADGSDVQAYSSAVTVHIQP